MQMICHMVTTARADWNQCLPVHCSTRLLTTIQLPSHGHVVHPGFRIDTNIPRTNQPIKSIDNYQFSILRLDVISGEQLGTVLIAANRREVVIDVSLDVHVVTANALLLSTVRAALCDYL